MNELLARAGALFLTPSASAPRAVAIPPADLVAVLASPDDLPAVAGGIAAELRQRQRARTALVCRPGARPAAPAARAARLLARRLADRDLPAAAAGGLCHLTLDEDAPRVAWRGVTAAAGYPVVVALSARDAAWDAFLVDADELFLAAPAGADPAYTELALSSLAALGPPAAVVTAPGGFLARRAAALGLLRLAPAPAAVPA